MTRTFLEYVELAEAFPQAIPVPPGQHNANAPVAQRLPGNVDHGTLERINQTSVNLTAIKKQVDSYGNKELSDMIAQVIEKNKQGYQALMKGDPNAQQILNSVNQDVTKIQQHVKTHGFMPRQGQDEGAADYQPSNLQGKVQVSFGSLEHLLTEF
jgi:hypothetical protein